MKKDAPAGVLTQARPKGFFSGWAARKKIASAQVWDTTTKAISRRKAAASRLAV